MQKAETLANYFTFISLTHQKSINQRQNRSACEELMPTRLITTNQTQD
ncbi:hypothetical protein SynBIOSE41_01216 [Synechococcus sp. BIOS-E4-1]|nr:hypothetical protein SynBIOSE41_01216 [Synechococcus sp. BIOS-E4-1]